MESTVDIYWESFVEVMGVFIQYIFKSLPIVIPMAFLLTLDCPSKKEIEEQRRKNAISVYSDGKECRNILELSLMDGSAVRFDGYSNAHHTLNSYKEWCNRVKFSNDGITLNYKDKTVFIPTEQVQRFTVINEDIL